MDTERGHTVWPPPPTLPPPQPVRLPPLFTRTDLWIAALVGIPAGLVLGGLSYVYRGPSHGCSAAHQIWHDGVLPGLVLGAGIAVIPVSVRQIFLRHQHRAEQRETANDLHE